MRHVFAKKFEIIRIHYCINTSSFKSKYINGNIGEEIQAYVTCILGSFRLLQLINQIKSSNFCKNYFKVFLFFEYDI